MSVQDLGRMVQELCEPTRQRVRRADGETEWVVSAPSLLDQLSSLETSSSEGARRAFGSRPVASIEALDLGASIDREASALVRNLGEDDDGDALACIRKLYGMTASLTGDLVEEVTVYIRRWYVSARILSGWDSAPFRPHNTCPACSTLGNIRIRVDEMLAHCIHCRATWDSASLGLLAQHIRAENNDEAA